MTITKLSYAIKNPNNVNVFLDDKYWVNIPVDLVTTLGLVKELEVTAEFKLQVEELTKSEKDFNKILNWCKLRPHSESEIKNRMLFNYQFSREQTASFISRLNQLGLINDYSFAEWFLQSKSKLASNGPTKLKQLLAGKGVSSGIIQQVVSNPDVNAVDQKKVIQLAHRILNSLQSKPPEKIKQLFLSRLVARGYDFKTATDLYIQIITKQ